jgi:hypothetical protein
LTWRSFRRSRLNTTNTMSSRKVTVGTTATSMATVSRRGFRTNVRHPWEGGFRGRGRDFETVDCAIGIPSRLDPDESLAPPGPELGEPDPHQSIGGRKRGSPPSALALEDEELRAEAEPLGLECGPTAEQRSERRKSGHKGRSHTGVRWTQTPGFLNDDGLSRLLAGSLPLHRRRLTDD